MGNRRILILLPANQVYGQERAFIAVAQLLRREGYDCHFLTHRGWGQDVADHLADLGFSSTSLPFGTIWSLSMALRKPGLLITNAYGVVRCSLAFFRVVSSLRPGYLMTGNTSFTFYILPMLLMAKLHVIFRHGDDLIEHSAFHRILNRILFHRVDRHAVNCQYLGYKLTSKYPKIEPAVIYNLPRQIGSSKNVVKAHNPVHDDAQVNLLYVGQIAEHKGIGLLICAFRELSPQFPKLVLTIVGEVPGVGSSKDPSALTEVTRATRDLPGQVFYAGHQDDLAAYYERADIHLCPSTYEEPSPNVIFEAKWYGLPSVVFNVGGIPELVRHQVDGYVCKKVDAQSLADGIRHFLSSAETRKRCGMAAREGLDARFGPERFRKQWLDVLRCD